MIKLACFFPVGNILLRLLRHIPLGHISFSPSHFPQRIEILSHPLLRPDTPSERHNSDLEENFELRGESAIDSGGWSQAFR